MSPRIRTVPIKRLMRPTRQVVWTRITVEEIAPGDVLAWGTVLAKAWGGPLGIAAWRVVIEGQHKPLWLAPDEIVHRRARAKRRAATVVGVVGSK
jgi:hypothetical protein